MAYTRYPLLALATVFALALTGCGRGGTSSSLRTGAGTITVFAASSLTDAFNQEATAFQKAHPGVTVKFNFGGSPTLVTQIDQGAPADVLATADEKNMKTATDAALVSEPVRIFARNRLVVIVPRSNPGGIATPADLAKPGLKLVLAQNGVPAGAYARKIFANMAADASYGAGFDAKVLANLVSDEANVKAVVGKIQLGEADAGVVYATDVTAGVAGDVTAITIPDAYNVTASYPAAVTKNAAAPALAQAFVDFLRSADGQAILQKSGFVGAP
jgi:molybdate transport system substrate-binding protein